jgi:hypothetical protein
MVFSGNRVGRGGACAARAGRRRKDPGWLAASQEGIAVLAGGLGVPWTLACKCLKPQLILCIARQQLNLFNEPQPRPRNHNTSYQRPPLDLAHREANGRLTWYPP